MTRKVDHTSFRTNDDLVERVDQSAVVSRIGLCVVFEVMTVVSLTGKVCRHSAGMQARFNQRSKGAQLRERSYVIMAKVKVEGREYAQVS